jgi:hypothetical protein
VKPGSRVCSATDEDMERDFGSARCRVRRSFSVMSFAVAIAVAAIAAGCGSQKGPTETAAQPPRPWVPPRLVSAARWLNTHDDGNVPWVGRAKAYGPVLCGAGLSVKNSATLIVRTVSRRGQWLEVALDTSTSDAVLHGGRSYPDDFGGQTPEEIMAGTWRCSFYSPFAHSAFDHIKFDGTRNPPAPPVDPVSRAASLFTREQITGCQESASGLDGAVFSCTEAWSGKEATVNVNAASNLSRVTVAGGRTYYP